MSKQEKKQIQEQEKQKDNYLKNTTLKQMLWDTNQLLYWINENLKEQNTSLNQIKTIDNENSK